MLCEASFSVHNFLFIAFVLVVTIGVIWVAHWVVQQCRITLVQDCTLPNGPMKEEE
jgi:hypothetical protein